MSTVQQFQEAADKATQASAQADAWANGPINTTVPTDSGPVPTIAEFNRAAQARVDASIDLLGWVLAGDFTAGCTVTDRNQYVLVVGGAGYRWDGVLPKVVTPGSSPTPIATGSWVLVGDATLRGDLASGGGSGHVGHTFGAPGAIAWSVNSALNERISAKGFGAVGDGVADDTAALTFWLAYLLSTGRRGYLPSGKYSTRTLVAKNGTKGLWIEGDGWESTELVRRGDSSDGAVLRISGTPGVSLSSLKANASHSETGTATTAIILKDCPYSVAFRVWVHNTGSLGMLAHHPNSPGDDLSYMVDSVHFLQCRSSNTGGGGLQMVGCENSGMDACKAEQAGTTGIYFKCPVRRCYSTNNQTDGAQIGTSLGTDWGTSQTGEQLTISNFRAKNVLTTARFNCMVDSLITNVAGTQTGGNTDGLGDGIRFENSFNNEALNINVKNIGNSRAAARFTANSSGNVVRLSGTYLTTGAVNSRFETGTSGNKVLSPKILDASTVRRSQDVDSANEHVEGFMLTATAISQTSVTITHNYRYDNIPLHRLSFWFSAPTQGFPSVSMPTENSIMLTFPSAYTGIIKLSLN